MLKKFSLPVFIRCVLCGICLAGSVPPWGWWPLSFIGIAILDRLLANQPSKTRFKRTWLAACFWLYPATLWMWDMTKPGYLVASSLIACFFAAAAAATPANQARKLVLPGAIAVAEVARWTWPFGGVPLAHLGLSQVNTPIVYAARIAGSLLVITCVVVIGQAISSLLDTKLSPAQRTRYATVALGFVAIAVAAGYFHPRAEVVRETQVALVQGGGEQRTRAETSSANAVFNKHLEPSQNISEDIDLLIWPENAINPRTAGKQKTEYKQVLSELARDKNTTFLGGWFYPISETETANYQSALTGSGEQLDRYDKVKIVPFGEYVPLRSFAELFSDELPSHSVRRGTNDSVLDTPVGPVGVSISWEGFFDTRARKATQQGAQLLTNPTNGSSYWLTQIHTQQVAANTLHAVENDRWVLQVAPTGLTAVIDPDGNVLQRTDLREQKVLTDTVEMRKGRTLASYVGFWPVVLYGLLAMGVSFVQNFWKSRE